MRALGPGDEQLHSLLVKVASETSRSQVNFYGDSDLLNLPVYTFFGEGKDESVVLASNEWCWF
jgi:hypothetical protein